MIFHIAAIAAVAVFFFSLQRIEPIPRRIFLRAGKIMAAGLAVGLALGLVSALTSLNIEKQAAALSVADVAHAAIIAIAKQPVPFWYPAFLINIVSLLSSACLGAGLARIYQKYVAPYRSKPSWRLDWNAAAIADKRVRRLKPRDRDIYVLLALPPLLMAFFPFVRIGLAIVSAPSLVYAALPMAIMETFAGIYAVSMAFFVLEGWLSSKKIRFRGLAKKLTLLSALILADVLIEQTILCDMGSTLCAF